MATLTTEYQLIGTGGTQSFNGATGRIDLYAKYNSQSIANNNTNYSIEARLVTSNGYIGEYTGTSLTLSGDSISSTQSCGTGNFTSRTLGSASGTVGHNSDGTKSISASASIRFSAWNKTLTVSGSATLPTIPRYASINSFTVSKNNETSLKFSFTASATIDYIWYSTNNGSSWTGKDITDGTSATFNVTGLNANTTYNCKIRVRRKDSQLTTDSSAISQTTYDYPYCSASSNFTIGNNISLSLYNPLGRTVSINIYGNNNTLLCTATRNINGSTSIGSSSSEINAQYNSIPNSKSGTYKVTVTYGSVTKTRNNAGTYSVNESECAPIFEDFEYEDTDNTVLPLTNDDQLLVNGNSNCLFRISTTNKAIPQYGATIIKYLVQWGNKTDEVNYSDDSEVQKEITDSTGGTLKVTAVDSRGVQTPVTKNISYISYVSAVVNNLETQRKNGVEAETYIKGRFSIFNGSWDNSGVTSSNNRLKYVGYSVYNNNVWSQYYDITNEILSKATSTTVDNKIVYDFDFDDNIKIHLNGSSGGFTIGNEYQIKILIKDGNSSTVFTPYSYQAIMESSISDGTVAHSLHKDNNNLYHLGINCMSDDNYMVTAKEKGIVDNDGNLVSDNLDKRIPDINTSKTTSDDDTYSCNYINNLYDHRFSDIITGDLAAGATYNQYFAGGCKLIWVRIFTGNFEEQKLFAVLGPNGYVKTAQQLASVSYHNLANANATISITTSGQHMYVTCKNTGTVALRYQISITNIGG